MADDLVEKSGYFDTEMAEWIAQAADNSDRSESYVLRELMQVIAEYAGEPPESVDLFADELADELSDE